MENLVSNTEIHKRWYVVHAYSGFEKSVAQALRDRIARTGMEDKFGEVLVPTEEIIEMRSGQKRRSERKFFPGYVLVKMELSDGAYHLIKNTPKVTGFLGSSGKPQAISEAVLTAKNSRIVPPTTRSSRVIASARPNRELCGS